MSKIKVMSQITLIIEKGSDSELWGRVESKGDFLPVTVGKDITEIKKNIKSLIKDYQEHEGKEDKQWSKVDLKNIEFEVKYEVAAFFKAHSYLNISNVATIAGLNAGLVRQYASGVKHPSKEQAGKIGKAIKTVVKELQQVELV